MTAKIDRPTCPNVFDADLPEIDYERCESLEEAHEIIRRARRQAPIAMGPHGPELLTYELVRSVLRDPRFRVRRPPHRNRVLRRRRGHRPPVPHLDHLRAGRRTLGGLAAVLELDRRHLQGVRLERRRARAG